MSANQSPLETLRQLKEWLDAGTITQQEFDTLKQKLLFSEAASSGPAAPAATPPVAPAAEAPAAPVTPPPPAVIPPADHVEAPPVEDPGLPTLVQATTPTSPPLPPIAPAMPAEPLAHPFPAGRLDAAVSAETEAGYSEEAPYDLPEPAPRNPLMMVLLVGGIVGLLGLMLYLVMGNRESERLTSTTMTAADSVAVQPEVGPQTERIELPEAAPETVRVVPALPPAAAVTDSVAPAPAATPAPAAEPAPNPAEVNARVTQALQAYYEDLKAAPFDARQHFAPQVERFYLLQNTTPAAIDAELTKSHFPEFTDAETTVEPGSLQVGPETEDGSRLVTYREKSRAFRQSKQQHQQTTAQVRARFDRNMKLVYLRQERLLENVFSE